MKLKMILIGTLTVLLIGITGYNFYLSSSQQSNMTSTKKATKKKPTKSVQVNDKSKQATPVTNSKAAVNQLTDSQKIALVLLNQGDPFKGTGNIIAKSDNQLIDGGPTGITAYSLSQEIENKTPVVIIAGDTLGFVTAQSQVLYDYLQRQGLLCSASELYQKYHNQDRFTQLAQSITAENTQTNATTNEVDGRHLTKEQFETWVYNSMGKDSSEVRFEPSIDDDGYLSTLVYWKNASGMFTAGGGDSYRVDGNGNLQTSSGNGRWRTVSTTPDLS